MAKEASPSVNQPIDGRGTVGLLRWAGRTYLNHRQAVVVFIGIGLLGALETLFLPRVPVAPSTMALYYGWSLAFLIVATVLGETPATPDTQ